jgi:hypothetical protein
VQYHAGYPLLLDIPVDCVVGRRKNHQGAENRQINNNSGQKQTWSFVLVQWRGEQKNSKHQWSSVSIVDQKFRFTAHALIYGLFFFKYGTLSSRESF